MSFGTSGDPSAAGRFQAPTQSQWAPTLTSHDPNPPLPLEAPTFGGEEIHQAPHAGSRWSVAFAVLPVFAFSACDDWVPYVAPAPIIDEADAVPTRPWPAPPLRSSPRGDDEWVPYVAPSFTPDDDLGIAPMVWPPPRNVQPRWDDQVGPRLTNFPVPSGLTLRLDFADLSSLTLSGSDIGTATDVSWHGRDFTASGSDRPTSAVDATLGQAAVFTASAHNVMSSSATFADLTAPSAFTLITRHAHASVASISTDLYGDGVLFIYGAPGGTFARQDGSGGYRSLVNNDDGGWPPDEQYVALALNTELVIVSRHTGGNIEIRSGIGTPASGASGDSLPATEPWNLGNAAGGGFFLDGAISDVMVWDRALDESEIAAVLAWLANKGPPRDWLVSEPLTPPRQWVRPWVLPPAPIDDDLPIAAGPSIAVEEHSAPTMPWAMSRWPGALALDDDLPVAASALVTEDDGPSVVVWSQARAMRAASADDDLPILSIDDEPGPSHSAWPVPRNREVAGGQEQEQEPAGSLHGCLVDDLQSSSALALWPRWVWVPAAWAGDEQLPVMQAPTIEDHAPPNAGPPWQAAWSCRYACADDDLPFAAALVTEDECPSKTVWPAPRNRELSGAQEQEPAGSLFGCLDEWQPAIPTVWRSTRPIALLSIDDDLPIMAPTLASDDGGWTAQRWPPMAYCTLVVVDDEIATIGAAGECDSFRPAVVWPRSSPARLPEGGDEYAAPPSPLSPDEDWYLAPQPWPAPRNAPACAEEGVHAMDAAIGGWDAIASSRTLAASADGPMGLAAPARTTVALADGTREVRASRRGLTARAGPRKE